MKHIVIFLIAISNFVVLETGRTQSPITFYSHLTIDNYLKDRQINRIDRDENGLFWFLENSVIQKYDGRYVTEQIPHPVLNPKYFKCLSDNTILLVSQESEIYSVNKEAKTVLKVPLDIRSCSDCQLMDVNLIKEKLFLYFRTGNIIKVYSSEDRKNFQSIRELRFSEVDKIINLFKVGEHFLVITNEEKVFSLNGETELELPLPNYFREINAAVVSNYVDEEELYFSLPRRNGTFLFRNGILETIAEVEKLVFAKKDRKGKILLALSRSYLHSEDIRIISQDKEIEWKALTDINETFIDAYVEDVEDKLLLGAHTGVFFVELKKNGIDAYHRSTNLKSDFGNVIMSFAQLPDGTIYYVKENKGIFKFEGEDNPEALPVSDKLLNNLNCIYDGVDEKLWISGYTDKRQGVLYSYDPRDDEVIRHDFSRPIMYFKRLNNREFILSSSISSESLLLKYDPTVKRTVDTLLALDNERSRRFEFHSDSSILVGTSKRLLLFNHQSNTIQTILPLTAIQTLVKFSGGYVICTLGKGIFFLNEQLKILKQVNEASGLTSNQIYSALEDGQGRFWIGTGSGLNVLDKDFTFIRSFKEYDGLSSFELNTNASIILKDGNMLFGTINGVTKVRPELVLSSSESAVINVPEISYEKDGDRVIQKTISDSINVPMDARNLTLSLIENDFHKYNPLDNPAPRIQILPEEVDFKFTDGKIMIPELISDQTKVTIFPSNPNKASQKLQILLVRRRSYQAFLMVLSIIGVIGIVSYFITNRIIKFSKKRESERRENEVRMAELELQALRSQMNPHFIFNSLGAILMYLQTHENKKAEKYLTKFAKLMRMFLESSKSKFITFAEEKKLLELYLELEKLRFEDKFEYDFKIDPRIDKNTLTLPSMLLQPFVENAINHGLYHKKSNDGLLSIKVIPDGNNVKVVIHDNGIGRQKSKEIRDQSIKKHRSRATEIIQERMQVLKNEKNIDVDIVYNDLKSSEGDSIGTEVVITIPKMLK